MRLYLVQHGDALPSAEDPSRPLSGEGRRAVERLAAFLARLDLGVTRLQHSGKLRAAQTAELLLWAVGSHLRAEPRSGLAPRDPAEAMVPELADMAGAHLLVGHLPFLQHLVGQLVGGEAGSDPLQFTPGTAVCLEQDPGSAWRIIWCIPPEVLPD